MKLTGKDGEFRIMDSTAIVANGAEAKMDVEVYDATGPTFTDKTSEAYADDTSYTGNFWADTNDKIYVGCTTKFATIQFLQGGGVLAIAAGTLAPKYYNGTSFTALTVVDGTASGGHTLAQDGDITFAIPRDWAKQGDASLDSTMYYIELAPTSVPSTKPSADILAPTDGQYFVVKFADMNFTGPLDRPRTEELLVMNRGRYTSDAHYIEGPDARIYEGIPISFSCVIDDTINRERLLAALACGNPNDSAYWTATGVTTKGNTKNDGSNANPGFRETAKKTVNIQVLFSGTTYAEGRAYYEVYFDLEEQKIAEAEEGLVLNCAGLVYGVIEGIHGFGNRY